MNEQRQKKVLSFEERAAAAKAVAVFSHGFSTHSREVIEVTDKGTYIVGRYRLKPERTEYKKGRV